MAKDRAKETRAKSRTKEIQSPLKLKPPKFPNPGERETREVRLALRGKQEGGAARPTSASRGLGERRPARAPCVPLPPARSTPQRSPIGGAGKEAEGEPGTRKYLSAEAWATLLNGIGLIHRRFSEPGPC